MKDQNKKVSETASSSLGEKSLCLMFQAESFQFLVPRIQVAEVVRYGAVNFSVSSDQSVTLIDWRNMKIPLISTELINPSSAIKLSKDSKIVILHGLLRHSELPFYAIAVNVAPRLIEVSANTIAENKSVKSLAPGEFLHVTVGEEKAVIPKFEYLEKYIMDALAG